VAKGCRIVAVVIAAALCHCETQSITIAIDIETVKNLIVT
jgi:hypothetical protein